MTARIDPEPWLSDGYARPGKSNTESDSEWLIKISLDSVRMYRMRRNNILIGIPSELRLDRIFNKVSTSHHFPSRQPQPRTSCHDRKAVRLPLLNFRCFAGKSLRWHFCRLLFSPNLFGFFYFGCHDNFLRVLNFVSLVELSPDFSIKNSLVSRSSLIRLGRGKMLSGNIEKKLRNKHKGAYEAGQSTDRSETLIVGT